MSRLRTLRALTVLCLLGSEAAAQHIALIKPGDIVAGKTLTGASNIAVFDTHRMVFRGTFEGNGGPQIGLFDNDLWTKAASVIDSTEDAFDGFTLSDLGQPSLSHRRIPLHHKEKALRRARRRARFAQKSRRRDLN